MIAGVADNKHSLHCKEFSTVGEIDGSARFPKFRSATHVSFVRSNEPSFSIS